MRSMYNKKYNNKRQFHSEQVGSLAALHFAKKGHNVHLYEYREGELLTFKSRDNFHLLHFTIIGNYPTR